MASFCSILNLTTLLIFVSTTLFHSSQQDAIKLSTISAAPAVLPGPPLSDVPSPALSPDIYPQFPTPAKDPARPPAESSVPTIPSSPSPPNPDVTAAAGPAGTALAPAGSSLGEASSPSSSPSLGRLSGVMFVSLVLAFCVM